MKRDKPSATAALILKTVLFMAYDSSFGGLIPKDARDLSLLIARKAIQQPAVFFFAIRNGICRWILLQIERLLMPGFTLHVACRKKFIDGLGQRALSSGATQAVVFGAGFDTFALRAASNFSEATVFEIDHPNTQSVKRASLAGNEVPNNLHFIPADLSTTSIADALTSHPQFDVDAKTVVVIEGVLMYLPVSAVKSFFSQLSELFENDLKCIFSFMERASDGSIQFKSAHPLIGQWLQKQQEPFQWGIERDRLPTFLSELGFTCGSVSGKADFISAYFRETTPTLAEGELIGVAEK